MPEKRHGLLGLYSFALRVVLAGLLQWTGERVFAESVLSPASGATAQVLTVNNGGGASGYGGFPAAVPEYLVDSWGTEQGLPHNSVNALLQTRDGFLWVGTAGGLVRFDGVKFTAIQAPGVQEHKQEPITALCEDRSGQLWIGTQAGGLLRYANNQLTNFTVRDGLLDNSVSIVAEDAWGTLWVGTKSGLNRWKDGHFSEYRHPKTGSMKMITGIHSNKDGRLWITTLTGIYELKDGELEPLSYLGISPEARNTQFLGVYGDSSGNLWGYGDTFLRSLNKGKRYNYFRSSDPTASRVCTLCERRNGELWIGTKGSGLFCLSNGEFKAIDVRSDTLHNDVRAILEDTEGGLWIGTSAGLARLKPRRLWMLGTREGLPTEPLNTLCIDAERRVWAGSIGAGLYTGQPLQFQRVRPNDPLNFMNYIRSVCPDIQGGVWAGTWGNGLFYLKDENARHYSMSEGLSDDVILTVVADPQGGVWAGTQSGNIHVITNGIVKTFPASSDVPAHAVRSLLIRHNGSVWAGLENGGVAHLVDGRFIPAITDEHSRSTVCALFEDSADRLWLGTVGGGIGCLVSSSRLYWCSGGQGLPDDSIYQILEDDRGDLWMGLESGIAHVPKTSVEKFARGTSHTLPAMLCEQEPGLAGVKVARGWPGAARAGDGKLWFATTKGIAVLDPAHLTVNGKPLPVIIESVMVDGRTVAGFNSPELLRTNYSMATPLMLSPRVHSLDFQYTALCYSSPQSVMFRHKLEGYDLDWVEGNATRKVHYGKLPAGDYTFRVTARASDGFWTEEQASMPLVVLPPVWRTWWFLSLCGFFGITLFVGTLRVVMLRRLRRRLERAEQQRSMERERTRIARDMHDEIGSKLTRISFLSELAKSKSVDSQPILAISETSRDLLATLDELVWAVNPRNDNLEHLAEYLGHYANEYFQMTSIECRIEIPPQIGAYELTSEVRHHLFLAFKESLNNVLKHAQATLVQITMRETPQLFEIVIQDNGCGFDLASTEAGGHGKRRDGNGLLNLRQRLADVGGECQIISRPGEGTSVRLVLFLQKAV